MSSPKKVGACDEKPFAARLSTREASRFKGLPDDAARIDLARTYLQMQTILWPDLVSSGVIPQLTQSSLDEMSEQFKRRYLSEEDLSDLDMFLTCALVYGIAYLRYSSDKSNPRSLDQQLKLILECAAKHKVFIPWVLVFADAGVTGRTSQRRGYQMVKDILHAPHPRISFLVIDELGRASRDAIESLQLGRCILNNSMCMLGASDGFDSSLPHAKQQLHFSAMIHESFVDNLKAKVCRGLRDTFENGGHIGTVGVGYRLEIRLDEHGKPVLSPSGKIRRKWLVDEEQAKHVLRGYELYNKQGWSPTRIAKLFNQLKVGNRENWQGRSIRDMFRRPIYKGLHTVGMTSESFDSNTGVRTKRKNPISKWKTKFLSHLRIVPDDLWQEVNDKVEQTAAMYRKDRKPKPNRTGLYPTRLFHPICGSCKLMMWNGRSGKYAMIRCASQSTKRYMCEYRGTHRSVRIIETALLNFLFNELFTNDFLERIVTEANQEIERQKNEPTVDVEKMRIEVKRKKRKLDAITSKLDEQDDVNDLQPIIDKVKKMNREIAELQKKVDTEISKSHSDETPLTKDYLIALLKDLRGLLRDDIASAAKVLEELTGPIRIEQRQISNGGKPEWWAHFELQGAKALVNLARRKNCPTAGSWEYLASCRWTIGIKATVPLISIPNYVFSLDEIQKAWQEGVPARSIAVKYSIYQSDVNKAVELAACPKTPVPYIPPYADEIKRSGSKYMAIGSEVVRLRDEEDFGFNEIGKKLNVSGSTAQRAYDWVKNRVL